MFGNHIIHEKIHEAPNYSTCKIEAFIDLPKEEILGARFKGKYPAFVEIMDRKFKQTFEEL